VGAWFEGDAMFNGKVEFVAEIKGNGIKFSSFDFNANEPGVDRVHIEAAEQKINSTVHLASVATREQGVALAEKVNTAALNRLAFLHDLAIEKARSNPPQFSPVDSSSVTDLDLGATMSFTAAATIVRAIPSNALHILKSELEQGALPGERNFGLLRSARQSESPVEEFMQLYQILLMLHNDEQPKVDAFIKREEPDVPQTSQPPIRGKKRTNKETIYTRLRNEFAHERSGVDLESTKAEMANHLGGLIPLVKRAIAGQQSPGSRS
jgi:hypothetical protein